jgi:hypothetical protein
MKASKQIAVLFTVFALFGVRAQDEDEEDEMTHRASLTWGRVFLEGGVQHRQFFKARFGDELPMESLEMVMAEPALGCAEPTNDVTGKLVFVDRGNCTWATKARHMEKAGASGVAIISSDDTLTYLPGPDGRDVTVGTVQVTNTFGIQVKALLQRQNCKARLIPIYCEKESGTSVCLPVTEEERAAHATTEGGQLAVGEDLQLDFLTAKFGLPMPAAEIPLISAEPFNACGGALTNAAEAKGKAVLLQRGGCPFVDKARAVSEAGGHVAIMINNKPNLLRMDSLKRYEAYDIATAMMMVGSNNGDSMKAAAKAGKKVKVALNGLLASTWQTLRNAVMAEQWPLDQKDRRAMFTKLRDEHAASTDRVGFITNAFKAVDPDAESFLKAESKATTN